MRLRAGAKYYDKRRDEDQPIMVRYNGQLGVVIRVAPKGRHIPPQAYVVFSTKEHPEFNEKWIPLRELAKAS